MLKEDDDSPYHERGIDGDASFFSKKAYKGALDDDSNSIYGSDVDSLPAYDFLGDDGLVASVKALTLSTGNNNYEKEDPSTTQVPLCVVCVVHLQLEFLLRSCLQVCNAKPQYAQWGKRYPTCGLNCAAVLKSCENSMPTPGSSTSSTSRSEKLMCVVSEIGHSTQLIPSIDPGLSC